MKKLLLVLLACFCFAGQAYGWGAGASSDNQVVVGGRMGPNGITPFVEVIKVNVGSSDVASEGDLAVGDVMIWNMNPTMRNGYSVVRADKDVDVSDLALCNFAGVLMEITDSGDTSSTGSSSANSTKSSGPLVASIAIRGFCQAKIDASKSNFGEQLAINGATLIGSFQTKSGTEIAAGGLSQDIGILMDEDLGTDGVYNVWLY